MGKLTVHILCAVVLLTACSTPQLFVPIPVRDADLYPQSQTKDGVAVAVDQLTYPQRVKQYFGADLIKAELLPVNIIVSNHGQGHFIIKPADVLLMLGKEVIDPVPVKTVEETVHSEYGRMSSETAKKVEAYFDKVALQETVVAPHENYQGIVFLRAERPKGDDWANDERPFSMEQLFREGGLKIRVAVTDAETGHRTHFGPFSLSGL